MEPKERTSEGALTLGTIGEGSLANTDRHSRKHKQSVPGPSYVIRSDDERLLRHHNVEFYDNSKISIC